MVITWQTGRVNYVGLLPLTFTWASSGAAIPVPASARGNIDYDQIQVAARTGNGTQLLTWNTPGPGASTSTGTPGQVAYDAFGNFYFCYGTDQWARIGPAGYSNTF